MSGIFREVSFFLLCEKNTMLQCQKDKFNIPTNVSYLNVAYMSPILKATEAAGLAGVTRKSQPWTISGEDFFQPVAHLKSSFAQLINCAESERIALVPSVSYGIANVVKNIQADASSNIIIAGEQFPSNYYPWKRLADETGATINTILAPQTSEYRAAIWNQNILNAINDNTVAVAMGHVHWADGTLFDLEAISQKCKQHGALLIIDGTQSVGALPFDIEKIQPDALICAAYKWLFGPYNFGFAFYGKKFDHGVPIEENWINRKDSDDFAGLVNFQSEYRPFANRYMMGEQSNFINVPMAQTALNQLHDWGVENIAAYSQQLTHGVVQELRDLGCQVEEDKFRCGHLFGVRLAEGMDMDLLKKHFSNNKIYVSQRGNAIRISTHLFNNTTDFFKLVHCFKNAKKINGHQVSNNSIVLNSLTQNNS